MNLDTPSPSGSALKQAAQAWCTAETQHLVMEPLLAVAFANILDTIWSQPWLGNATTGELLKEIEARVDCTYSTVKGSKLNQL